jgi:hypothetical protein
MGVRAAKQILLRKAQRAARSFPSPICPDVCYNSSFRGTNLDRQGLVIMAAIFAFHGYPWLIHRLTYRRTNHKNLHVRGYREEGTTTTPFDMVVLNDMDRFHLVEAVIEQLPQLGARAAYFQQAVEEKLLEHRQYIREQATTCRRSRAGAGLRATAPRRLAPLAAPRPRATRCKRGGSS